MHLFDIKLNLSYAKKAFNFESIDLYGHLNQLIQNRFFFLSKIRKRES